MAKMMMMIRGSQRLRKPRRHAVGVRHGPERRITWLRPEHCPAAAAAA
jgi:hypothetical protein